MITVIAILLGLLAVWCFLSHIAQVAASQSELLVPAGLCLVASVLALGFLGLILK